MIINYISVSPPDTKDTKFYIREYRLGAALESRFIYGINSNEFNPCIVTLKQDVRGVADALSCNHICNKDNIEYNYAIKALPTLLDIIQNIKGKFF